ETSGEDAGEDRGEGEDEPPGEEGAGQRGQREGGHHRPGLEGPGQAADRASSSRAGARAVSPPGSRATNSTVNPAMTARLDRSAEKPAVLTMGPSRYTASELTPNDTASRLPATRERMWSSTYWTIRASMNGMAPNTKIMKRAMAA